MLTFVRNDYVRLQQYLEDYSLGANLGSKAREDLVKRGHKLLLAALQVWALIEPRATAQTLKLGGHVMLATDARILHIGECFSDLTSTLQASFHGLYKPASMSLRSAIENVVRGLAGITSKDALTTTNVYHLFELAKLQPAFAGEAKQYFHILHQEYRELCKHTHSATPGHMTGNVAMESFPRHDSTKFRELVKHFEKLVPAMLAVLVLSNSRLYLDVSPRAQDLLDEVVPDKVRLTALGAH